MSSWVLASLGVGVSIIGGRILVKQFKSLSPAAFNFGKRFYEGGFEANMTRREAALILGCRQTADKDKIMERYRTLMKLNHPDIGGSPFIAQKINEAKDMLSAAKVSSKPGQTGRR